MDKKNLEVNFQRLLAKTSELADKEQEMTNWRLEKYVENLDKILEQLKLTAKWFKINNLSLK